MSLKLEEHVYGSVWQAIIPHLDWKPGRLCMCLRNAARPRLGLSRRWPRTRVSRCAPGRWPSQPHELYCWWSCGPWWLLEPWRLGGHGWAEDNYRRSKRRAYRNLKRVTTPFSNGNPSLCSTIEVIICSAPPTPKKAVWVKSVVLNWKINTMNTWTPTHDNTQRHSFKKLISK